AALLEQHLAHLQQPALVARPGPVELPRQRKPHRVAVLAAAAVLLLVLGAVLTYPLWRPAGPAPVPPGPAGRPATERLRSLVLQGRPAVRAALIDFTEPERRFGAVARDNAVRRADQCNAFLVRFDLAKLGVPPKAHVAEATVSFYVWDPSSRGKTKVCAFPLQTAWDEATVTWRHPAAGQSWRCG